MMTRRNARWSRALCACTVGLAVAALAPACSSVQARATHFAGRPDFAPTDVTTVEILHRPPMRPHEVLGQIMVEPQGDPSTEMIEEKLREETARMGGSAAVIVHAGPQSGGAVWTGGPWWAGGAPIQPATGDVVAAIVVRFTTDHEP